MARWYVAKIKAHADIFKTVFGSGAVGKEQRVRPVYAWQQGDGFEVGMEYLTVARGIAPAEVFHSMACAPYMTIGPAGTDPALTVDGVLAGWRSFQQNHSLEGPWGFGEPNMLARMAAIAVYWGLSLQAYEAGTCN